MAVWEAALLRRSVRRDVPIIAMIHVAVVIRVVRREVHVNLLRNECTGGFDTTSNPRDGDRSSIAIRRYFIFLGHLNLRARYGLKLSDSRAAFTDD